MTTACDIERKCNSTFYVTHLRSSRSRSNHRKQMRYRSRWMCRFLLKQCHFESWLIECGWRSALNECMRWMRHSLSTHLTQQPYGFIGFHFVILIQFCVDILVLLVSNLFRVPNSTHRICLLRIFLCLFCIWSANKFINFMKTI